MNINRFTESLSSNNKTVININLQNDTGITHLDQFLKKWDKDYKAKADKITLFDKNLVSKWSSRQRQHFIRIFYHSRGHFRDFLWHLGNFAPNKIVKDIILQNIAEEFNYSDLSHEQLYLDFAEQECLDLSKEYLENKYYIKNMKTFNEFHMKWLYDHKDWISKLSAFSAYERLDSTDYELLSRVLFQKFEDEHKFFKIHREAEHFDKTYVILLEAWDKNKSLVQEAFHFIAKSQIDMWIAISNEVFSF